MSVVFICSSFRTLGFDFFFLYRMKKVDTSLFLLLLLLDRIGDIIIIITIIIIIMIVIRIRIIINILLPLLFKISTPASPFTVVIFWVFKRVTRHFVSSFMCTNITFVIFGEARIKSFCLCNYLAIKQWRVKATR